MSIIVVAVNVALLRPAFLSGLGPNIAALAVDNDLSAVMCTQYSTQPWWAVDLGTKMDVDRLCVTNDDNFYGQYCCYKNGSSPRASLSQSAALFQLTSPPLPTTLCTPTYPFNFPSHPPLSPLRSALP